MEPTISDVVQEILGRKALDPKQIARSLKARGRVNAPLSRVLAYTRAVLSSVRHVDGTRMFIRAAYDRSRYRVANRKDRLIEKRKRGE